MPLESKLMIIFERPFQIPKCTTNENC